MPSIDYDYAPCPTIGRFSNSDAFLRALIGPVGGGKSSGCVVEFPYRALAQRPGPDGVRRTRWVAVRNSYRELSDTTIRTFHQWLPPQYFGRWYETDKRYVIKAFAGCEFEVLFRALDTAEDVKKVLSLDITGGWVNEYREIPWSIIEALQGRCGRYPPRTEGGPTWSGLWMDTNPPDVDHASYRFFEENSWQADFEALMAAGGLPASIKRPEDYAAIFHQPSGYSANAENLANLPEGYYNRLGIGKSAEWKKVYIEGKYGFVSDDKAVYPEYRDDVHLKAVDPVPGRPIIRSYDFGLTPACVFSQLLPDGRWLIFDEMIPEGIMGADRFSDEVLQFSGRSFRGKVDFEDYGDPAGAQRAQTDERTCFEILQSKGIMIEPGEQTLAIRIESVRKPLRMMINGEPAFILHPRCKTIRKGFLGGYHFRRMSTTSERYTNQPDKNKYSHPHDALQYAATILYGGGLRGEPPIDDYPQQDTRSNQGRSKITGY